MSTYTYKIGVTVIGLILLTSCGRQHRAESIVEDFIEANAAKPEAVSSIDFRSIDSTRVISDSIISVMRRQAAGSPRYRSDMSFDQSEIILPLIIVRVSYKTDGQECSDTYYLDCDLTRVVALKTN